MRVAGHRADFMLSDPGLQIVRVADVKAAVCAVEHVGVERHVGLKKGSGALRQAQGERSEVACWRGGIQPFSLSNNAFAAAVSASCLLPPVALASPAPLMLTVTVKRSAWCGPERSVIAYSGGLRRLAAAHS